MADGYRWRKMRQEETLAQFVTLWIANMAGNRRKRPLTMRQLFKDGRFNEPITQEEIDFYDL